MCPYFHLISSDQSLITNEKPKTDLFLFSLSPFSLSLPSFLQFSFFSLPLILFQEDYKLEVSLDETERPPMK